MADQFNSFCDLCDRDHVIKTKELFFVIWLLLLSVLISRCLWLFYMFLKWEFFFKTFYPSHYSAFYLNKSVCNERLIFVSRLITAKFFSYTFFLPSFDLITSVDFGDTSKKKISTHAFVFFFSCFSCFYLFFYFYTV